MKTRRVWKPVDIGVGLRLYKVRMHFWEHTDWNKDFIVAAQSPTHAAKLMEDVYKDTEWKFGAKPDFMGYALNVYQPLNEDFDE